MFEREENPCGVKKAKIVVGLASYKEADSIAYPTRQASLGLTQYYDKCASVIVNCDNHSPDGTEGVFMATKTDVPKIYITTPPETPGKGYNFENMFRKMLELGAEALVCVDADLMSITPEWIKFFVDPIFEGYDLVTPVYSRHKYDGTITKNICFPLIYGVLGKYVRQPIGGDFAMSTRFAEHLIRQPWHRTTEEYGIDIFMSMNAVLGGFKMAETGLGAKVHKPSAPKLGPMFLQVVGTAFLLITRNIDTWKDRSEVDWPALFGLRKMDKPQDLDIDRSIIEKQAREGFRKCRPTVEAALSPDLYAELSAMFERGAIDIVAEQWARIVYDMIAAFSVADDKETLIESLKGLYFGRVLSFMNKTWDWTSERAEEEILDQARLFHAQRGYLIEKLEAGK